MAVLLLAVASSTSIGCGTEDCRSNATCAGPGNPEDDGGTNGSPDGGDEASTPSHGIRLSIVDAQPLARVVQGKSLELELTVERQPASQGPIRLEVTGLPVGASSSDGAIAPGSTVGAVTIQTAPNTPQGVAALTITAIHEGDGERSEAKLQVEVRGRAGTVDETFATAGIQGTLFAPSTGLLEDVRGLADGRVIVGGQRVNNAVAFWLSAAGALDTGFGSAGFANLQLSQGLVRVAAEGDGTSGRIFALSTPSVSTGALFLLDPTGAPVTSFNGTGRREVDIGPGPVGAHDLASLPDGKALVLSRYQNMAGGAGLGVTRWKLDGTPDTTYGANPPGLCSITIGGTGGTALGSGTMLVAPDGSVRVFAGASGGQSIIKGCTASGAPDTTVGPAPHHVQTGLASGVAARSPNGDTVVLSTSTWHRYNSAGVSDTSIGAFGAVELPPGFVAAGVVVQSDLKVLIGGSEGAAFKVLRYLPTGLLDPDFGDAGVAAIVVAGDNTAELRAMTVQSGGRILLAGTRYDTSDGAVVRLWD